MLKVDLVVAMAVFLSAALLLVFASWAFYNLNGRKELDFESAYMRQCSYCAYIFFDYRPGPMLICPRCRSLMSRDPEEQEHDIPSSQQTET